MAAEPPLCPCHGLPMGYKRNGKGQDGWECREKRREYNRRRQPQRSAWARAAYQRSEVVRVRRRMGRLRHERGQITQKLQRLSEEANGLVTVEGCTEPEEAESDPPG